MIDRDTYDLLTLAANWFTAFGTVGAVIVALVLARRQNHPGLKVTSGIYHLVSMGQKVGDAPKFFRIGVVNTGIRDVVINGLCWRLGVVRRQTFVQLPGDHPASTKLPKRLVPGDSADFLFPIAQFRSGSDALANALARRVKWLSRLRVGVYLSTGEEFLVKLDADARKLLNA